MSNSSEGPQQILRFSRGRPFGTSDVRPFVRGQSSHDLKLKLSPELLRVPCVWCHQFHADAAFQGLGNLHSPHVDSIISSWLRLGWQPRREVALFSSVFPFWSLTVLHLHWTIRFVFNMAEELPRQLQWLSNDARPCGYMKRRPRVIELKPSKPLEKGSVLKHDKVETCSNLWSKTIQILIEIKSDTKTWHSTGKMKMMFAEVSVETCCFLSLASVLSRAFEHSGCAGRAPKCTRGFELSEFRWAHFSSCFIMFSVFLQRQCLIDFMPTEAWVQARQGLGYCGPCATHYSSQNFLVAMSFEQITLQQCSCTLYVNFIEFLLVVASFIYAGDLQVSREQVAKMSCSCLKIQGLNWVAWMREHMRETLKHGLVSQGMCIRVSQKRIIGNFINYHRT